MLTEKQRSAAKEIERSGSWPTYIDGRTRHSMCIRGLIDGKLIREPYERWVVTLTAKCKALLAASVTP